MPFIPATVTVTETGFEPAFRRVQQSGDFDCPFAVIPMLCGTTLDAVRNVAIERFRHSVHGPYWTHRKGVQRALRVDSERAPYLARDRTISWLWVDQIDDEPRGA